jgi:hypothetical protein
MYASKKLTTEDMKTWEEKDVADQEDWDTMTEFFSKKMAAMEIYLNNAGGLDNTKYDSTNNVSKDKLANLGGDL